MGFLSRGASDRFKPGIARRDTRSLVKIVDDELYTFDGSMYILIIGVGVMFVGFFLPFGGEIGILICFFLAKRYGHPKLRWSNFPWRVPIHAKLPDGSRNEEILPFKLLNNPEKFYGEGVTYLGFDHERKLQAYSSNSDDRTHMIVLGTTGSGKTEFLLGIVVNQLVQNAGFIYCDAKGDPSLQRHIYRLVRRFSRDDDLLTVNFITSGIDFFKAQKHKITNTFNMMSNTSSGMLIELLNNLLDDSGGGGGDMWKGRAMAFIAALTPPLTYLRDMGYIQLSPKTYLEYMELPALEELVFNHEGKYGKQFDKVCQSLVAYIRNLPGYNTDEKKRKKQDSKTLEQHGFISMQLTRAINDLTFSYGHIFGVEQGDIDIFDVVLNRRCLTVPLPALERTPETLKMLGKLIVGAIKQMMAGSLGNRIEGLKRVILDSRPTNSPNSCKLILDEWGYIVVKGASVMPAQARSLNFSIVFAAQDFSDIKRGSQEEAEATWANSTVKVIGRLTTGEDGDSYKKIAGFAGQETQAEVASIERRPGDLYDSHIASNQLQYNKVSRLPNEDLAGQENGEFTLLLSKKTDGGKFSGVQISRIYGFYTAGPEPKALRLNDLAPILTIEKQDIFNPYEQIEDFVKQINIDHTLRSDNTQMTTVSVNQDLTDICLAAENNLSLFQENPTQAFIEALASYQIPHLGLKVTLSSGAQLDDGTSVDFAASMYGNAVIDEHREKLIETIHVSKKKLLDQQEKDKELQHLNAILRKGEKPSEIVKKGLYRTLSEFTEKNEITLSTFQKPVSIFNIDAFYDEIAVQLKSVDLQPEHISKYRLIHGGFENSLGETIDDIETRMLAAAQGLARSETLEQNQLGASNTNSNDHSSNTLKVAHLVQEVNKSQILSISENADISEVINNLNDALNHLSKFDWQSIKGQISIKKV
ncbi:TPA: TraM recognition domain-containing protein [Acinetobacter baumannii]|uniref:TraM recognition domain-containing protein n=1 Tax=Acinetobacter baumannii TaxID=470 RepID=UPI00338FCF53